MGQKPGGTSSSSCSTTIDIGTYDDLLARGHQLSNIVVSLEEVGDEALAISIPDTSDETGHKEGNYDDRNNGVVQPVKLRNSTYAASPENGSIIEPDTENGNDRGRADDGSEDFEES